MADRIRQGWLAAILVFLIFVALAGMPVALQSRMANPWVPSAKQNSPVPLAAGVVTPVTPLQLSATAQPLDPGDPAAAPVVVDSTRMAALVAGEDLRLRTLLHHISRLTYPEVVPGSGQYDVSSGVMSSGISTLVLPGPANYTIADLQAAGAVVPLAQGGFLLVDSVLVGSGATLTLGGSGTPKLLMQSTASGFTSIVTWGGTLVLYGDFPETPMTIMSWDTKANAPVDAKAAGRPYIRAVGGTLDLKNVQVSYLGFWSGRTGGVAWTGISSRASTGSATNSSFMHNAYGAFVSRSNHVQFTDDLFELNQLDGIRLHRGTVDSTVLNSAAARNGANGFVISRGATGNTLRGNLSINNAANGFSINGQSLVSGAGPSGGQTEASVGTVIEHNDAENNARTGILIEGGSGTVVRNNIVCTAVTAIAVRHGATDTFLVGNEVTCGGRVAVSIGPQVTGTTIDGNALSDGRIGILIRNSPGVRLINNRISEMTVFGITVHGTSPGVVGNDNYIAGTGFRAVDVRAGASSPLLTGSDTSHWLHQSQVTPVSYLRYHPLITTWLAILLFVVVCAIVIRFRRRPERPYAYTVPWRSAADAPSTTGVAMPAELVIAMTAAPVAINGANGPIAHPVMSSAVRDTVTGKVAAIRPAPPGQAVLYQPFAHHEESVGAMASAADKASNPRANGGDGSPRPRKTRKSRAPVPEPVTAPVASPSAPVAAPIRAPDPPSATHELAPVQFWNLLAQGAWAGDPGEERVAEQGAVRERTD